MQSVAPPEDPCKTNPDCITAAGKVPLLKNVRKGLIDPDTPKTAMTKQAADGTTLNLVVGGHAKKPS